MKLLRPIFAVLLATSISLAQSSAPGGGPDTDTTNITDQIKSLQSAIAAQQKQIEQLQHELELKKNPAPHVVNATLSTAGSSNTPVAQGDAEKQKESPLSFRIGGAEFTPGGFMDLTGIFRSTNVGSLGTNFFSIPYSNTAQGQLSETRFTAQNSRLAMKVTSKYRGNDVTGYLEMDFLGNDPGNAFVTSNSHTNRMRLYWADLRHGNWEILGGQSWSWMTPNRVGLSPMPADVFFSQNMDFNYQVGLTWTRAPQFRVAYHPNKNWAFGVALENPQQFIGQANQVVLPTGLAGQLGSQLDAAGNLNTPNLHPDVISKVAYDNDFGGKHFHAEGGGVLTSVKVTTQSAAGQPFVDQTKTGGGVMAAMNVELIKNFRILANAVYSDGGGRYIFGMGPAAVIRPDGTPSLVHSGSGIGGFEYQVTPQTMIYGYYGGAYYQRNFFPDTTSTAAVSPLIGFGFPGGSATNNLAANRAVQEGTIGWIQTFWKNPQYGAFQLITQASYLTRSPWFVPANQPKNAHLGMGWVDLRYTLP
ncbi:MAG TPA: hypothetical protein VLT16_06125 [Candidatus Limnocylindrales bacterium]|nr:hypothetical protein [Candidatus Limnocylindrales bacterium]